MEKLMKMYTTLFNEITRVENDLGSIVERLKEIQRKTEEMYIEDED